MDISDQRAEKIKQLLTLARMQGFLTQAEIVSHLPESLLAPEHVQDIVSVIRDMGIKVVDTPDN
ncbi:MAG: RNA polymerase sigma factor region1.1 domain-containing protein [Steroidobacteraceae bacterium]